MNNIVLESVLSIYLISKYLHSTWWVLGVTLSICKTCGITVNKMCLVNLTYVSWHGERDNKNHKLWCEGVMSNRVVREIESA